MRKRKKNDDIGPMGGRNRTDIILVGMLYMEEGAQASAGRWMRMDAKMHALSSS